MKLKPLDNDHFDATLNNHTLEDGHYLNVSLSKLFSELSDESNKYEVSIKVAALNSLYSTAITYIQPVVDKIVSEVDETHKDYSLNEYVSVVDNIARIKWVSKTSNKQHHRYNLSFSSKYIHFLSGRQIPIYDSYIWIVMIGYLNQYTRKKHSFNSPITYKYFYSVFNLFKETFKLNNHSNYLIDKFLWQYGKELIFSIVEEKNLSLGKSKTLLKKRITSSCT